jgi:hypothetical protein
VVAHVAHVAHVACSCGSVALVALITCSFVSSVRARAPAPSASLCFRCSVGDGTGQTDTEVTVLFFHSLRSSKRCANYCAKCTRPIKCIRVKSLPLRPPRTDLLTLDGGLLILVRKAQPCEKPPRLF